MQNNDMLLRRLVRIIQSQLTALYIEKKSVRIK